jgi:hypothetical protein
MAYSHASLFNAMHFVWCNVNYSDARRSEIAHTVSMQNLKETNEQIKWIFDGSE